MHKSVCKYCARITPCETGFGLKGHVLGPNQSKYNPPMPWCEKDDKRWKSGIVVCPYYGAEHKIADGPHGRCQFRKLHETPMVCVEEEHKIPEDLKVGDLMPNHPDADCKVVSIALSYSGPANISPRMIFIYGDYAAKGKPNYITSFGFYFSDWRVLVAGEQPA